MNSKVVSVMLGTRTQHTIALKTNPFLFSSSNLSYQNARGGKDDASLPGFHPNRTTFHRVNNHQRTHTKNGYVETNHAMSANKPTHESFRSLIPPPFPGILFLDTKRAKQYTRPFNRIPKKFVINNSPNSPLFVFFNKNKIYSPNYLKFVVKLFHVHFSGKRAHKNYPLKPFSHALHYPA